jgi:hypothetical protein
MPFAQYSEQAILAGMFGNCCGCVRTAISAAATAQTAINTGSISTGGVSGNMDQTPNTTAMVWIGTPGTGATQNQYTAPATFKLTGSAATSLTMASQSVGLARSVGDFIFLGGGSSAGGTTTACPCWQLNTIYIGLSTTNSSGGTQSSILANEPSSTGSYARIAVVNNQVNWPLPTAATPSVLTAGGPFSFPASTGSGWSTGATNLLSAFLSDSPTLGGGNVLTFGALGTPQAVNASGITLSFAASAITITAT